MNSPNFDIIEKADSSYLRSKLMNSINQRTFNVFLQGFTNWNVPSFPISQTNRLIGNFEFMYAYFKLMLYAEAVALSFWLPTIEAPPFLKTEEIADTFCDLLFNDCNKATLPISLSAWLTLDDFRWHEVDSSYPTDLNYGLLARNPTFIIPYAMFILDVDRLALINNVKPGALLSLDKLAYDDAFASYPFK